LIARMRRLLVLVLSLSACGPGQDEGMSSSQEALNGTWQAVGYGVTLLDTGNPLGSNVFIGYSGYNIDLAQAQSWVGALYDARLHDLGVRWLFAVQGPADSLYNGLEIGNSKIVAALNARFTAEMGFIVVAGHSSGSFVADELLQQMDTGSDPSGVYGPRMVYFALDGDQRYVAASGIDRLRRAYYVNAFDPVSGVSSPNHAAMDSLGATFAAKGGSFQYDASSSGCTATWCVHISLINTKPHVANNGSGVDYADFAGRPVNTWWLNARTADAALGQCDSRFLTQGAIEQKYLALGGCSSVLGAPTTDELTCPDGVGHYNQFKNSGSIYWTAATGAHEVHGVIRTRWVQMGWEHSTLGYPTSDESQGAPNVRYSRFVHGAIYWSGPTGAHEAVAKIYDTWASLGLERGALGLPISDEVAVPGGRLTDFEHGSITAYDDGGVEVVTPMSDAGMPGADAGVPQGDAGPPADDGALGVPLGSPPVELAGSPTMTTGTGPPPLTGGCNATGAGPLLLLALGHALRRSRLTRA
jgi:hypothetical protein